MAFITHTLHCALPAPCDHGAAIGRVWNATFTPAAPAPQPVCDHGGGGGFTSVLDSEPCGGGKGGGVQREGGGWHKASVSDCLPLAAPIGLSPPLILTLCGPERVVVVSTEPLDNLWGGINGQVAVSALGSSCACPTAFITFCPWWRLQHIQFHRHVQPAPSLNGWGCDLQDSIGLGVHPGQWSLLHQVLLLAGTHLAHPVPAGGWSLG